MPGGSAEREGNDRQCKHCGLWYSLRGLDNHEESCKFADVDHRVQELTDPFARERATDVEDDRGEGAPEADGEDAPDAPDTRTDPAPEAPSPGPNPGPDPADGPGPDLDRDPEPTPTRTDGGPSSLPTDFEDAGDAGADVQEPSGGDGDPADECPSCGSAESVPIEAIPEPIIDAAPALAEYDQLCVPCSFDAGQLTDEVEAY